MQRTCRNILPAGLILLVGLWAGEARGQMGYGLGYPSTPVAPTISWGSSYVVGSSSPLSFETPVAPYSYYAAFPGPARIYVPLGPMDEFSYGGRPYGHPYDRWTWGNMGGSRGQLDRYFYPPVR